MTETVLRDLLVRRGVLAEPEATLPEMDAPSRPILSSWVQANALAMPLRSGVAQCVVTSPPYLGQRIYGSSELELGREGSVSDFVSGMRALADEVRRVLTHDGVFWLNLGDKGNGSGGAGGDYDSGGSKEGRPRFGKFNDPNYAKTQFLDVPGKVAAALQNDGWRLRQTVIWDKGQESRESLAHVARPRTSHEVILMLQPTASRPKFFPEALPETGSVWHFPPAQAERKGHLAPFPDELPRRCIEATTEPGDLVVDPFLGSGTTVRVARELGRHGVGFDLYPPTGV